MTQNNWLGDKENQQDLYTVVSMTLSAVQSEELPLLKGIYEDYIQLAQEGDVVLDGRRRPFSFAGSEELVTLWLIPIVIDIGTSLILAGGAWSLKLAINRLHPSNQPPADPSADPIGDCVRRAIDKARISLAAPERQQLERTLIQSLHTLLDS